MKGMSAGDWVLFVVLLVACLATTEFIMRRLNQPGFGASRLVFTGVSFVAVIVVFGLKKLLGV